MVSGSFVLRGDTCDDSQDKNTAPVTTEAQPRRVRVFTISTSLEGIYVFRDPVVTILTRMSPSPLVWFSVIVGHPVLLVWAFVSITNETGKRFAIS